MRPEAEAASEALLELAAYLASSASLLPDEPPDYGQFRLLEGVLRTMRMLSRLAPDDTEMATATDRLERHIVHALGDADQSKQLADELTALLVRRLTNATPRSDSADGKGSR